MNNNFYKVTERIKEVLNENPLVNTVIYARNEDADLLKNNLYPLAHINPLASTWSTNAVNEFTFEIGVLNQRTRDNRHNDTKFLGNDNLIDNHNTCYSILNEFLTDLSVDNRDSITMISVSDLSPIYLSNLNGLDGFAVTITLQLINKTEVC
jgi:hypothetical protein